MGDREIVEKIATMDPDSPSEIDGDIHCFFCNAWIGLGDQHALDCAWVEARKSCGLPHNVQRHQDEDDT